MKELFDPTAQLERLKKFQLATVEYVFHRMFEIENPALRFLVADEVGLGKTMVARGVIAKAVRWFQERNVPRIDIVYICSNAAIAAQNISRLNVLPGKKRAVPGRAHPAVDADPVSTFPTRLTLLPLHARKLDSNPINFVSFTPGTTFDLKRSGGTVTERALIWHALRKVDGLWPLGLGRLLRGRVREENWAWQAKQWDNDDDDAGPDDALLTAFQERVETNPELLTELTEVCLAFKGVTGNPPEPLNSRRYHLIGRLRRTLAEACLHALQPDLIVLDEFQRFKTLFDLEKGGDAAELAKTMFEWQAVSGPKTRTLLLSATPYKMYTADGEVEDDHYADFLGTMKFLFDSSDQTAVMTDELRRYRRALQSLADPAGEVGARHELTAARDALQKRLLTVMVRTERVSATSRRDSMVEERVVSCAVGSADVAQAISLDRVRDAVDAQDMIEYWKSAPYLLSFMKSYDVIGRLAKHVRGKDGAQRARAPLLDAIDGAQGCMLHGVQVAGHGKIDPANARLRMLIDELSKQGSWQLLWIPPSLPYITPSGRYAAVADVTKSLVFSSWNVVPDVIAALTSYEAERLMFQNRAGKVAYGDVTQSMRGLLRFSVTGEGTDQERFAGMGALLLGYPSPSLAILGDPLELAICAGQSAEPEAALAVVAKRIGAALEACGIGPKAEEHAFDVDARWYWVALAVLDSQWAPKRGSDKKALVAWLTDHNGWRAIMRRDDDVNDDHESTGFDKVLDRFVAALSSSLELRSRPADLERVLATLAMGAPAVCALRSLRRQAPELDWTGSSLLQAAARVGEGFRTLFNVPETMALLQADENYWREAANYGVEGNLQSVLDEHVHTLRESLGLLDASANDLVTALASELAEPLTLRTSTLTVNNYTADRTHNQLISDSANVAMRTRYGLRFGELRGDNEKVLHRVDLVRKAFNAPFRPFILASTSVGQEGLDFHTWCHRVVHWNLPTNPVDLEQREGRVHRFKGLAVRRNVARQFGFDSLRADGWMVDPWTVLFARAHAEHAAQGNDLVPYWVYDEGENPVRVQRCVPIIPLSKEEDQFKRLKENLVLYRLAFGQPRQEDLIAWLSSATANGTKTDLDALATWQLDLRPPPVVSS
jgi:hypothetical protein